MSEINGSAQIRSSLVQSLILSSKRCFPHRYVCNSELCMACRGATRHYMQPYDTTTPVSYERCFNTTLNSTH